MMNFFAVVDGNLTFREHERDQLIVSTHEELDWCLEQCKANGLPTMNSSSVNWPEEEGVTDPVTIELCKHFW